eukprot:TRINITY_DN26936_c0_g1_i1.p1 TRINITY_DN26936_c0_g1~~TRINITY_DN26936_c0_g1_i1.p1  ORF type:complete len:223 (+),score=34.10 TRINITY_DN26936_c0_g1_i1:126-794(+)
MAAFRASSESDDDRPLASLKRKAASDAEGSAASSDAASSSSALTEYNSGKASAAAAPAPPAAPAASGMKRAPAPSAPAPPAVSAAPPAAPAAAQHCNKRARARDSAAPQPAGGRNSTAVETRLAGALDWLRTLRDRGAITAQHYERSVNAILERYVASLFPQAYASCEGDELRHSGDGAQGNNNERKQTTVETVHIWIDSTSTRMHAAEAAEKASASSESHL